MYSKIKSVLYLIAFPNCCTGSTGISIKVLSHASHFPLLVAHIPCFSLCFFSGLLCCRSRASSGAGLWFKKSVWCHQGDQNSSTLQHGVLPSEWECCSSHSQWWQGDDLGVKIQHFWQEYAEQVTAFTFLTKVPFFPQWFQCFIVFKGNSDPSVCRWRRRNKLCHPDRSVPFFWGSAGNVFTLFF